MEIQVFLSQRKAQKKARLIKRICWLVAFLLMVFLIWKWSIAIYVMRVQNQLNKQIQAQKTEINQLKEQVQDEQQKRQDAEAKFTALSESFGSNTISEATKAVFRKEICSVFGQGNCTQALHVQGCEDGKMVPTSIHANKNGSVDVGLFQINSTHRARVEKMFGQPFEIAMMNPFNNIKFTYEYLYKTQGWNPWYSSGGCHKLASK